MAYDEELAARIRTLVADRAGVTEKRMFGGLAFLVNGNMAVAASGQGGLLASPLFTSTETLDSRFAVAMSGLPSPFRSPIAIAAGSPLVP
jgi:hypothetical protein